MNNIKHYIKGNRTESAPKNNDKLGVIVDWTGDKAVTVDFDIQKWMGEDAETIINERANGLGSFVGIPYRMEVDNVSLPDLMFDLRKFTQYGCNEVDVGVRLVKNKDWFEGEAGVLQFRRLEDEGKFLSSDFVQVPYNINYIPDGMEVLMLSISTYLMAKELAVAAREVAFGIATVTSAASGLSIGLALLSVLQLIIRIAYFVALIIAITKLINSIISELYSRTRYHTAVKTRSLFRVACQELGLTFESTIFDIPKYRDEVIMCTKTERGRFNISQRTPATPTRSDAGLYFFGEFVKTMMTRFNADYRINNGVFRFERWDWWATNSSYVIPDNFSNQDRAIAQFTDNADDFKGGYTITYQFDEKDQNTFDNITNMAYDVITKVGSGLGAGYENAHGVEYVDIPLARATRKATLTRFENLLYDLFRFVDTVTGALGGGTNYAASIQSRINNMELSQHFTSKAKVIHMNSALSGLSLFQASAVDLWNEFHYINSFKKINNKHNQWIKYTIPCSFCVQDFVSLLENNFAELESGETVEVERLTWTPYKDEAILEIRVNELYTTNLVQTFIATTNTANAGNINI